MPATRRTRQRIRGRKRESTLTVPNVLTSLRIAMAATAGACFAAGVAEREAVVLCVVAALLDAFDGWYARTFAQCSSLGEHLDPLADKLLMAVVYGVVAFRMDAPVVWLLVGLIAVREVGMTAFRSYSLRRHRKFIPANRLGKVKMVVQSAVGLAVVSYAIFVRGGFDFPAAPVAVALAGILVVSYLSAVAYVRAWMTVVPRPGAVGTGVPTEARGYDGSPRMVVGK